MVEPLLVSNDLHRDGLPSAVIPTVQDLTERALAQVANDLVSVCQVVTHDDLIVTPLVIIPKVVRGVIRRRPLLPALRSDAVDRRVIQDFLALILGQSLSLRALQNRY